MSLTEEQLSYLNQYGFDELLLENWRKGVREGWYSEENNRVESEIHAPDADTIHGFPKRNTGRRAELKAIGNEALRNGEFGVVILNGGMATRFHGEIKARSRSSASAPSSNSRWRTSSAPRRSPTSLSRCS